MAYSTFSTGPFGFSLTHWVKRLLIANVAVFVVIQIVRLATGFPLARELAFLPLEILSRPWTLLSYMFVHEGFWHLLFNMLGLFFFGPVLEERWGARPFLKYYLIAGLGGALLSILQPSAAIIGASGAVFGIMVAYAYYWPDNPIYIWGIFPVKAKYLVGGLILLNVLFMVPDVGRGSGTAHLAHLGGAAIGFAYLKSPFAPSPYGEVYGSHKRKRRSWLETIRDRLSRRRRRLQARDAGPTPIRPEVRRNLDDVDRLLDKISETGLHSLTPEERRRLEEASRHLGSN